MVGWSDLGAGLRVGFAVAWSQPVFWGFLRRWLFSRVALGSWAVLLAAVLGGAVVFGDTAWPAALGVIDPLLLLVLAGPLALAALAVLDLPHLLWSFHPPVTAALRKRLRLSAPQVAGEVSFLRYLAWSAAPLAMLLLAAAAYQRPAVREGDFEVLFLMVAAFVVAVCASKLFVRSALGGHFAQQQIDDFVDATRNDRILLWVPALLAAGWALHRGLGTVLPANPLVAALLELVIVIELLPILAVACSAALLLACSRMVQGPEEPIPSETLVMPHRLGRLARHRTRTLSPVKLLAAFVLVGSVLAAGAHGLRAELTDAYLLRDPAYKAAVSNVNARFAGSADGVGVLDPADGAQRLRAGLVAYGCSGNIERVHWLTSIGIGEKADRQRILACAVCDARKPVLDWVAQVEPGLGTGRVALAAEGAPGARTWPLSCAVNQDDRELAARLLRAGSHAGAFDDPRSPAQLAIAQQRWDMLKLLVRERPAEAGKVLFTALAQARRRDPRQPALVLPRLLEAGVPLHVTGPHGRTLLHWAADQQDLALARVVLQQPAPRAVAIDRPDAQGATAWMHLLRRVELDGAPMSEQATELLRLLLPPDADVNVPAREMVPADAAMLPAGWTAARVALNQPALRAVLGPTLDYGKLAGDPQSWWKFTSLQHAEEFVRGATPAQLARVENPQAPEGLTPKKLSQALAEAGWAILAAELEKTQQPAGPSKRRQ